MSERSFDLIARDPTYLPEQSRRDAALRLLDESFTTGEGLYDKGYEKPSFLIALDYEGKVTCPRCKIEHDVYVDYGRPFDEPSYLYYRSPEWSELPFLYRISPEWIRKLYHSARYRIGRTRKRTFVEEQARRPKGPLSWVGSAEGLVEFSCCGATAPFAALEFSPNAFFSRYRITLHETYTDNEDWWFYDEVPGDLPAKMRPEKLSQIESLLGCRVIQLQRGSGGDSCIVE